MAMIKIAFLSTTSVRALNRVQKGTGVDADEGKLDPEGAWEDTKGTKKTSHLVNQ